MTQQKFLRSLTEGYKNYLSVHIRSVAKILPMHRCVAEILSAKLGDGYTVRAMGTGDGKEHKFAGRYYDKFLDITVLHGNQPVSALGFKFVTSNYQQNSNNYFEGMLGETANIKRGDLFYGQILILKQQMPYFSSDKKQFTKVESISGGNLSKYLKLDEDTAANLHHKPDMLFIAFARTGDEARIIQAINSKEKINRPDFNKRLAHSVAVNFLTAAELRKNFDAETADFLQRHGNFNRFIEAFVNSTKGRTYARKK